MHDTVGMVQPEDITGVVSFLVGPDSKFINGQSITVDGGYSVQWEINKLFFSNNFFSKYFFTLS